jgi:hypothetical protein
MMGKQLRLFIITTATVLIVVVGSTELLEQNVTTNNVNRDEMLANAKNRDYLNKHLLPDWKTLLHHGEQENEDYRKFVKLLEKLKDDKYEVKKGKKKKPNKY